MFLTFLQDTDFLFSWQVIVALGEALQATEVKLLRKVGNRNLTVSAKLKLNSQLMLKSEIDKVCLKLYAILIHPVCIRMYPLDSVTTGASRAW